jgi:hypothetical protein
MVLLVYFGGGPPSAAAHLPSLSLQNTPLEGAVVVDLMATYFKFGHGRLHFPRHSVSRSVH